MTSDKSAVGAVRDPRDLVIEYDKKMAAVDDIIAQHAAAVSTVELGATVGGSYGREQYFCCSNPSVSKKLLERSLLKSAWWAAYDWCNMKVLATAADKKRIENDFQNPVAFTSENLVATFGPYLADQRTHILRGLAEAFIGLDDAYKSHSKVKVGVKGLPKRVIINNARSWGYASGYGWDKMIDMLNALHVYDGDGIIDRAILDKIGKKEITKWRGLTFKWFQNGNVHIAFDQHACLQINRGLAEYYGDVLPDVEPDKTDMKPDLNKTDVSKDLQYYPTPVAVARTIFNNISFYDGDEMLEPQCGCGRLLDAAVEVVNCKNRRGWNEPFPSVKMHGVEYHAGRADQARAKGYTVTQGNFLEIEPNPKYNKIFMNPPFYGKHYLKHVEHALKFLADGGVLISILPATAHYDHKKLPEGYHWRDLPVGAFAESGTRVPTGYATWHK